MGEILILRVPSQNLKQLELSGNIDHSYRADKLCSTLSSASYYTPHTGDQPPSTPGTDRLSAMAQSHSSSQTSYDSRSESVAGANSKAMSPFSRFTSKLFSLPTRAELIVPAVTKRAPKEVKPTGSDSQPAQSQSFESIG